MDPHVMAARGYQPFIDLARQHDQLRRAAYRSRHGAAAAVVDPYGETADRGAYVKYPVDDLLAVLALESQRHRCMVIGEDLGTVPVEIVGKLRDSGVYSYKVLYFESDGETPFPRAAGSSGAGDGDHHHHDPPTLRGYWQSGDLTLGNRLGLYPDAEILRELFADRERAARAA